MNALPHRQVPQGPGRTGSRQGWCIWRQGFTLIELLVTITIIAILAGLLMGVLGKVRSTAQGAYCANNLHQLAISTRLYLNDNQNIMFALTGTVPGGKVWWYGYESTASSNAGEGNRTVDITRSPLYPYIQETGGVEICPSFPYSSSIWKAKYTSASWGYGMNYYLSNAHVLAITRQSEVLLFGDCAQINTFLAPASPSNPMLEEFPYFDITYKTIHFRHGACANMLFLDGHVEQFHMYPGTQDMTIKSANVGRISPVGSMQYLQ